MNSSASSILLLPHLDFPDQRTILEKLKADPIIRQISEEMLTMLATLHEYKLFDPDETAGISFTVASVLGVGNQKYVNTVVAALKVCAVSKRIVQQRLGAESS